VTDGKFGFSVIVPAYNEAENVDALFHAIDNTFRQSSLDGEVIFVDDGSTDDTLARARSCEEKYPYVKVVAHRKNWGKTEAITTGVRAAASTIIVVLDADLQFSPDDVPRFVDKIEEGYDIVTGKKKGHYEKRAVSAVYNTLSRKIFYVPVSDQNSMKAFRKETWDELHLRHDWHRFFVALAYNRGYSVTEIDVELFPRRFGQPKYSGLGRVVVGLLDLLAVKFKLTFARKPLLFFGSIGFVLISLGVLVGLVAVYMRVVLQAGFRPLLYLVMLLIIVGFVSFIGGFIGEVISDLADRLEQARAPVAPQAVDLRRQLPPPVGIPDARPSSFTMTFPNRP